MAIKIREDNNIQGFKIGQEILKLSLFADDITCFLKDNSSYNSLFETHELFGECSGLKVNHEKTEIFALGNSPLQDVDFPKHNICVTIKILGVYFGYDVKQRDALNFRQNLKDKKKSINMWKWRGLSLLGKIQIVKTFAVPKIMYRALVIPLSKELIKEANSIIYGFIWNGKDNVKRHALKSDIKNGGLRMLDIESMIKAKRVMCLKKFLLDHPSWWKIILGKILSSVGGRFLLYCNFDTAKLKISLPAYYKECLDAWFELNRITPSSTHEVINEIIWNRFLCIDKMSIYRGDMIKLRFLKIGDVLRANNSSRLNVYGTSLLSPEQNFFLMSLIDSFPAEWRASAKSFTDSSLIEEIPNDPKLRLGNGNSVPILDISSKQTYEIFLRKKQIPPTAKRKLTDKYPDINVEWDKVYSLPFRSTLESKTREFQYKILNCIVYTNEILYRFGLAASPSCTLSRNSRIHRAFTLFLQNIL